MVHMHGAQNEAQLRLQTMQKMQQHGGVESAGQADAKPVLTRDSAGEHLPDSDEQGGSLIVSSVSQCGLP